MALKVVGLMNVQYAIQRDTVYVLEVNPRASRTVPYVSKATGVPLAKVAARLMAGKKLADMKLPLVEHQRRLGNRRARILFREIAGVSVQQISRRGYHPGAGDALDRRSDGHFDFYGQAFAKAQLAAGQRLPRKGTVFLSVNDRDKKHVGAARQGACTRWVST